MKSFGKILQFAAIFSLKLNGIKLIIINKDHELAN